MLINVSKNYAENDVVSFKVVYGDEIVCRFIKESDTSYTVTRPLVMVQGGSGVGLMQAMLTTDPDGTFEIQKAHVVLHGLTEETVANHHREVTSGIKIVKNSAPNNKVVHHNNISR
jgi:hypothetical protein